MPSRRENEYEAVLRLEHYFRAQPFKYTLTPHSERPCRRWPTSCFTHRGYCQMFSGAMALVLRMHGIPARVAVGFTAGQAAGLDTTS